MAGLNLTCRFRFLRWRVAAAAFAACLFGVVVHVAEPAEQRELRWWRGNTHTHTLWSDGNDFPEMIADWYRGQGYHFLALSDHNVLSDGVRWMKYKEVVDRGGEQAVEKYRRRFGDDWVEIRGTPGTGDHEIRLKPLDEFRKLVEEPGRFLMIQGEEISDRAKGLPVHLNATNLQDLIAPLGGRTVVEAIENNLRAAEEQAKRTGREILVHLNHPNWGYAITAEEMAAVLRERFFEVYNGHPGINHLGDEHHPGTERLWDIANTIRLGQLAAPPLYGLATDDSHNHHGDKGSRPGRGWIMVRAANLDAETLIQAIKSGDFYASSGVALRDVRYDPEKKVVRIEIQPEQGVQYTTHFIGTQSGFDPTSAPRVDTEGKPIRSTRIYSDDVGQVLSTVTGTTPSFQLTGKELYVRAVISSTKPHHDPSFRDQRQQAWTQPVGWQERLNQDGAKAGADIGGQYRKKARQEVAGTLRVP